MMAREKKRNTMPSRASGYAKKVIDGEEEQNEKHQIRKGIKKFLP